jgi:hypothetical protein
MSGNLYDRASSGQPLQPVDNRATTALRDFSYLGQGRARTRAKYLDERRLPTRDAERIDNADRSAQGRRYSR